MENTQTTEGWLSNSLMMGDVMTLNPAIVVVVVGRTRGLPTYF